jgi:hypothetical protein
MKKFTTLLLGFCLLTTSFGSSGFSIVTKKASEIYLPVGSTGQKISLLDLSKIDVQSFQTLTGRHLNFFDRLAFKAAQKKLRKSINADGTIENKKLSKLLEDGDAGGFHLGGFALGFLVGLIGVLIAYLINDDKKKSRVKWAWIGFGIGLVLYLILILAVF